ncbi:MAG: HAD-IIB family hydrolase [Thermoanaerobaculia bacterium]
MPIAAVLTDLDGTLLEGDGSLGAEAKRVVASLRVRGVPVVPMTSKTEAELREWLTALDAGGFGSFENGAGVVTPGGTTIHPGALPVARLREILEEVRGATGVDAPAIDEIPRPELARLTGLTGRALETALRREYDLPFLPPAGGKEKIQRVLEGCEEIRLTAGGIFWHLTGPHDKGDGARTLLAKVARPGLVIGLGDAANDIGFLSIADVPVLVPGPSGVAPALRAAFPRARIAPSCAGTGWARAVEGLLEEEGAAR